jgi:hypothetical protein
MDEDEVVSLTYAVNAKEVLSVGVAFRNDAQSHPSCRVYKSNRKQPYTLVHHHLALGTQIRQMKFLREAKFVITLSSTETMNFISIFKSNKEKLLTY